MLSTSLSGGHTHDRKMVRADATAATPLGRAGGVVSRTVVAVTTAL